MSKEMNGPPDHKTASLYLLRKNVEVLAGVISVRIGKQSNFRPKTAKVRGRDREQAIFDDDRAPVMISNN